MLLIILRFLFEKSVSSDLKCMMHSVSVASATDNDTIRLDTAGSNPAERRTTTAVGRANADYSDVPVVVEVADFPLPAVGPPFARTFSGEYAAKLAALQDMGFAYDIAALAVVCAHAYAVVYS